MLDILWKAFCGVILTQLYHAFRLKFRKVFFFKLFGGSVCEEESLSLIYSAYNINPNLQYPYGIPNGYPFIKPIATPYIPTNVYAIEHPVSSYEINAVKYLTILLADKFKITPTVQSDLDTADTSDLSYIAFGGPGSNIKSHQAIGHPDNKLLIFNNVAITELPSGRVLYNEIHGDIDYGIILKVCPTEHNNRERVWIVCAGFGEWGTSGAAKYLSLNWRSIVRRYGKKPFALVVQVRVGQDDSAREVYSSPEY